MVTKKRVYNTRRNSRRNTRKNSRRFRKRKNMVSKRTRSRNFNKRGNRKSNRLNKRNIKGGAMEEPYTGAMDEPYKIGDYTPLLEMANNSAWSKKVKEYLLNGKPVPKGTVVQLRDKKDPKKTRGVNDTLLIIGHIKKWKGNNKYKIKTSITSEESEYDFRGDVNGDLPNWVVAGFMYMIEDKNGSSAEQVSPFTGEFALNLLK